MNKQQTRTEHHAPSRLPFWGQLILLTAMLLSGEAFVALPANHPAYASTKHSYSHIHIYIHKKKEIKIINIIVLCEAGNGGYGGIAIKKSSGASGGHGGNCIVTIDPKMLASLASYA